MAGELSVGERSDTGRKWSQRAGNAEHAEIVFLLQGRKMFRYTPQVSPDWYLVRWGGNNSGRIMREKGEVPSVLSIGKGDG